ncbi:MAG: hypothetical protein AAF391_05835 [Bacteroidota bacterium]
MKLYSLIILILAASCSVTKSTNSLHSYTGDAIGCGNFIVYKLSEDKKEYLSIAFNASTIEWEDVQAYAVDKTDILEIKRKKYDGPIDAVLCNDVMAEKPSELLEEIAIDGSVEIYLSELEREKAKRKEGYKVTLVLRKVVFDGVAVDYLKFENVYVGWLPG